MTTNLGTIDCIRRAALGASLLYLGFAIGMKIFTAPLLKYGVAIVGLVKLAMSTLKIYSIYSIPNLKTCNDC